MVKKKSHGEEKVFVVSWHSQRWLCLLFKVPILTAQGQATRTLRVK